MGTLVSKLFTNKVSSLPVFDKEENRYNAFFDYTDAVSYIVQVLFLNICMLMYHFNIYLLTLQYYETRGSGGVEPSFAETQYSKVCSIVYAVARIVHCLVPTDIKQDIFVLIDL